VRVVHRLHLEHRPKLARDDRLARIQCSRLAPLSRRRQRGRPKSTFDALFMPATVEQISVCRF
jgi:hypothetical protein